MDQKSLTKWRSVLVRIDGIEEPYPGIISEVGNDGTRFKISTMNFGEFWIDDVNDITLRPYSKGMDVIFEIEDFDGSFYQGKVDDIFIYSIYVKSKKFGSAYVGISSVRPLEPKVNAKLKKEINAKLKRE